MTALPLSHLSVLDLTAHRAGPTAVRQLADWGAHVIKIEPPSDGKNDSMGGARHGFDFQNLHRNKKSITLNLKSTEGHAIFMKLATKADVIVENYRSDVKHRLKVDYDTVAKVNPRIVYGSIAGFGQSGPDAARPGVDQIAQGMGGLMSVTGLPGQGPVRVGIPIVDLTAGGFLAQAILVALLEREVTGVGRYVHTSLLESMIGMLDFQAARWLMAGEVARQVGNNHPIAAPTGLYPTSDGQILLAATGDKLWERFCKAAGADALWANENYRSGKGRLANRDALNEDIARLLGTRTSAEWFDLFSDAGIPCGPVYSIDKVFEDRQVKTLPVVMERAHDRFGTLRLVTQPNNIEGHEKTIRLAPAELGEHTREVLAGLGYSDDDLRRLKADGVI